MSVATFAPAAVAMIARRLLGDENRRLSTSRDLRFGSHGSISVLPERGVFHDHESGASGGVLDLVIHAGAARTRRDAAELLERDGTLPRRETPAERRERAAYEGRRRLARVAAAAALWRTGEPIAGTVAETYLRRARAICSAPLDSLALRFSPEAPVTPYRPDQRRAPALLARAQTGDGSPTGLHVTYLRPDGAGKAELNPSRKMLGLVGGAHVPLIPGRTLVVGEGVESTFSAWEAVIADVGSDDLGAAAGLSTSGVAAFAWPLGTIGLILAPDRDANGAGERAAEELATRAHRRGLYVRFLPPPAGVKDWNDSAMGKASS